MTTLYNCPKCGATMEPPTVEKVSLPMHNPAMGSIVYGSVVPTPDQAGGGGKAQPCIGYILMGPPPRSLSGNPSQPIYVLADGYFISKPTPDAAEGGNHGVGPVITKAIQQLMDERDALRKQVAELEKKYGDEYTLCVKVIGERDALHANLAAAKKAHAAQMDALDVQLNRQAQLREIIGYDALKAERDEAAQLSHQFRNERDAERERRERAEATIRAMMYERAKPQLAAVRVRLPQRWKQGQYGQMTTEPDGEWLDAVDVITAITSAGGAVI